MFQQEILFQVLSKYGLPDNQPTAMVKSMNKNCKVKLKIQEVMNEVGFKAGVATKRQHGSILFLFMMQAIMETLKLFSIPKAELWRFLQNNNPLTQSLEDTSDNLPDQKGPFST